MIVAGEASGDLHGGGLITELKRLSPELEIFGVGGNHMRQAGMELLYNVVEMAVVGFTEVLSKILFFKNVMKNLIHTIKIRTPDLVILIDYPGFNLRFANKVHDLGIRIMYYIAPQVWAWAPHRKKNLAKVIHQMVVILPFEKSLWEQAGIPTEFVGHPLLDSVNVLVSKEQFFKQNQLNYYQKLVGLLPGSRVQEVERHLPEMLRTILFLRKNGNSFDTVVAKAPTVPTWVYKKIMSKQSFIKLVESQTYSVMKFSDVLVVASGTATLESAYFLTPMIVVYQISLISFIIAKNLVNLHNISLVNVVAGKEVVPEFIQNKCRAKFLAPAIQHLLYNSKNRSDMIEKLYQVKSMLGRSGASLKTARIALKMINHPYSKELSQDI